VKNEIQKREKGSDASKGAEKTVAYERRWQEITGKGDGELLLRPGRGSEKMSVGGRLRRRRALGGGAGGGVRGKGTNRVGDQEKGAKVGAFMPVKI